MKDISLNIKMTGQQLKAIDMVKENRISILTGKPGTGKTTATRKILQWSESEKLQVIQCAPTGKAAKKMLESTGYPSATIHSTLNCKFDNGQFAFEHNEFNPLRCDLLIVDEFSMITNSLFASLLRAVNSRMTRVLLIGDFGQLASVGPGAILKDLIDSGLVPMTELDIIHRNSGKIVEACALIHSGKIYKPSKKIDLEAENKINLIHIETKSQEQTVNFINHIVSKQMPIRGYNPVWDIQVISPTNKKTILSCENLNKVLQKNLNDKADNSKSIFFENDKVINTKNERVVKSDGRPSYIVNGDMGKVIELNKKFMMVEFIEPTRLVKLSTRNNNLLLAYAVTGHKMQGSEQDVIVIPVDKAFSYSFDRRWIYTAISRAKDICITVGNFTAVKKMIKNNTQMKRKTMLKERLIADNHRFDLAQEFCDI